MAAADFLTPTAWLESLEVGGPYDIPRNLNPNSLRATASSLKAKTFSIRKPSSFKPPVVYRTDDGAAPVVPLSSEKAKPMASKYRRGSSTKAKPGRAPNIEERIMALNVGARLSLAKNQYGIRERAAIISKNTGRQFTVDMVDGGKVLTRRG